MPPKFGTNYENADPASGLTTFVSLRDNNNLALFGRFSSSVSLPTTVSDFEAGALFIASDTGILYQNSQTVTTSAPVWNKVVTSLTFNTVKVHLTSTQILALNTTPISLLPAPGTGLVYQVLSVTGRINFLTAAYATHTQLNIVDTTAGTVLFEDTGTLLAATSTKIAQIEPAIAANAANVITTNGAVSVTVATGNPATGAGSLDLYITYMVVTL